MEQYMSKTRADYGSGVARPKIEDKDNFELKGHFIKELRTNTFSSSDHEDANEHIEKVPEIVNLFYLSNITIDQEVILFYNGLGIPTRQILNSRGAIPLKTAADANIHPRKWTPLHQRLPTKRRREYPRRSLLHNNFGWTFQGGDIVAFCSGTSIKGTYDILHTKNKDMPEDIKVPLILERPFLSTARAKIDVYKRKITLRVGEERIIFTSVKPASSLIKRVYMLSLRERMELDLESRLMGENLVLNRSLDPFFEDYIKLNDLNEPFELRRNQGDDLMPTIEEGKVIEEFRTRDDELDIGIDDYPSYCNYDKKIHIDFIENMDAYRDEGMGDVIFGNPF
ncbi:hypothetical protein Tco_0492133 [Tanacetum coccineum]